MTPKQYFDEIWDRSNVFAALHAYVANNAAAVMQPDELLRAEWAMRVGALDLYVHEVVAQNLLKIFQGIRPTCPGYSKLQISSDTLMRIHSNGKGMASEVAFDLEVRTRLERVTYQYPDDIADGIRMISGVELWAGLATHHGAKTPSDCKSIAAAAKSELRHIVNRRNKIVHEGDLHPASPRTPWPITRSDVNAVRTRIEWIVTGIEAIV